MTTTQTTTTRALTVQLRHRGDKDPRGNWLDAALCLLEVLLAGKLLRKSTTSALSVLVKRVRGLPSNFLNLCQLVKRIAQQLEF